MGANESKRFTEIFPETPVQNRQRELRNVTSDPRSPGNGIERTPLRKIESPIYEEIPDPRSPSNFVPRTPITCLKDMAKDLENVIQKDEEIPDRYSNTTPTPTTTTAEEVLSTSPKPIAVFSPPTSPGAALTLHDDEGLLKENSNQSVVRRRKRQTKKKSTFQLSEDGQPPRSPLTPRNTDLNAKPTKKRSTKLSLNSRNRYRNFNDDFMSPLKTRGCREVGVGKENSVQMVL